MPGFLVVNADDLGVSESATRGIIRAHRDGIVTSASLAVTTPSYRHAVEECVKACPDLGIGLHFTLTSGRPACPPAEVPLLVDRQGLFRWRFLSLLAATTSGRPGGLREQIGIELEAQLLRLHSDGIRPDHINGERHVHLIPAIFDSVVAAARRHGIPFIRAGREMGGSFVPSSPSVPLKGGFVKSWLLSVLTARDRPRILQGLRSPDRVASYLYSGRVDLILTRLLDRPPDPGISEVMVHPGDPDGREGEDLGNRELERYLALEERRLELQACVKARGRTGAWRLTSYRKLAQLDGAGAGPGFAV